MTDRAGLPDEAERVQGDAPPRERIVYQIANQLHANPLDGPMQRRWHDAAAIRHAAMTSEHRQLVEAVRTADGVSMEQAESQVTAFEKHFRDNPL